MRVLLLCTVSTYGMSRYLRVYMNKTKVESFAHPNEVISSEKKEIGDVRY
jgi:hypothetical protein